MIVTAFEQLRSGAEQSCNFYPSYLFSLRSSFRSAPSDNDWYSPCPVPTERSGTRNGERIDSWGKKLHCSSGVPIVPRSAPLRATMIGALAAFPRSGAGNGERIDSWGRNCIVQVVYPSLSSLFRSAPWGGAVPIIVARSGTE